MPIRGKEGFLTYDGKEVDEGKEGEGEEGDGKEDDVLQLFFCREQPFPKGDIRAQHQVHLLEDPHLNFSFQSLQNSRGIKNL